MEHPTQMLQYLYDETRSLKEALEAGRINIGQLRGFLVHSVNFFETEIKKGVEAVPMSTVEAEAEKRAEEDARFDAFVRRTFVVPEAEEAEEVPCGCEPNFWKACVHECSVCLKALTLRDGEGICGDCEEDLVTVEKEWPEDSAEAKKNSRYGDGAFHALVLRISANNHREAAHDTDDAEEVHKCLQEAKRLDARASDLLYKKADSTFEPWWFTSWDYWMQPGSTHSVPAWAKPAAKPVAAAPAPTYELMPEPDYKHKFWPSPRPKLFAKACAPEMKSMKHQDALEFLAERAKITVPQLLEMAPGIYIHRHMGNKTPDCWRAMSRSLPW